MGGCASKNKQPREEAYTPTKAPGVQPDFEEIIPESKPAVSNKPPIKLNGTVSEGDKREYRNSLVGPGGVILANHPEVKDETDPTIPYIDASEDELEDEPTPSRSKPTITAEVEAAVEATVESAPVTAVEVVAPSVPKVPEVAEVSKGTKEVKVPTQEVSDAVEQSIKAVEVHHVEAAKPEVNVQLPEVDGVPAQDVGNVPAQEEDDVQNIKINVDHNIDENKPEINEVPKIELDDSLNLGVSETGSSLVDEVMRDMGSEFMSSKESYPIEVEAVTESVKQEVDETVKQEVDEAKTAFDSATQEADETVKQEVDEAKTAFDSATQEVKEVSNSTLAAGEELVEQKTEETKEGFQNGFEEVEDAANGLKGVAAPIVDGVQEFDVDKAFDELIQSNGQECSFDDINESAEFTGFRLAKEEETDCVPNPELIAQASESVGVVYSPYIMGIGFRVGDKCIITAYHLIREMLDKIAANGNTTPEKELVSNKEIWVQFDYIQMGEYEFDNLTRFRFASIRYTNPQLDVAVVELEEHELKTMPPPLVNFCGIGKRHEVEFVGHDPADHKRRDPVHLALQPTITEIQKAGDWCQKQGFPPRGYDGLKDMTKLRFQCAYQRGSSGTPGVVMCEDEVYVVVLLTKGYPSFYLDVDERQQQEIPQEFKLVEAASLSDVYVDMKDDDNLSELCTNIFGFAVSKQQS